VRSVHGAVVQVQQVGAPKLGRQGGVQAWSDAGPGPVPQPTPGRRSGAVHGFCGDIAPRDSGPQHVHDAGERCPVGTRQPTGVAAAPFGSGRQQRGHPLPQVVRTRSARAPDTLPTKITEHKTRHSTH